MCLPQRVFPEPQNHTPVYYPILMLLVKVAFINYIYLLNYLLSAFLNQKMNFMRMTTVSSEFR